MGVHCKNFLLLLSFVVGIGCLSSTAQEGLRAPLAKKIKVKNYTVLAQYEPEMVLPADKRLKLKTDRQAAIKERRQIIDMLDISDGKRRRLLKELYYSPSSYKLDKVIADIRVAEDEEDENN